MSQSSKSAKEMNIFLELSTITDENKASPTGVERGTKRALTDQIGDHAKKGMLSHNSCNEQASDLVTKSVGQPKFVTAAEMVTNVRTRVQMMPEISDEELLKMAIDFEKKYPQ